MQGNGDFRLVKNLLKRIRLKSNVRMSTQIFETYSVKNGETPEIIADKLYDDPELYWTILLVNDITDRYHQWPMSNAQFEEYLHFKYDDVNAVHHYEVAQLSGDRTVKIVLENNTNHPNAMAITNYDYEDNLQNEMRNVRLLDPSYIDSFVEEFKLILNEGIL